MDRIDRSALRAVRHSLNQDSSLKLSEVREMVLRHVISSLEENTGNNTIITGTLLDLYSDMYIKSHQRPPETMVYQDILETMKDFFVHGFREVWPEAEDVAATHLFAWPLVLPRDRNYYPVTVINELAWLLGHMEAERLQSNTNQA